MLNNYAEVVLGISAVKPGAAVAAGVVAPYDAELERMKLDLQARQWEETKARWEAERVERKKEREANLEKERMRIEAERAE